MRRLQILQYMRLAMAVLVPGVHNVLLMLLMFSRFCHPATSAQSAALSSAAGLASRELSSQFRFKPMHSGKIQLNS